MRRALVLLLALVACSDPAPPAPPATDPGEEQRPAFELRDVVAARITALDAELAAGGSPAEADPERVRGLLAMLAPGPHSFEEVALADFASLGDAAVPELERALGSDPPDEKARLAALQALAACGTDRAAEGLLGTLEASPNALLRAHAAWRIGSMGIHWTLPRLVLRLKYEKDHEVVLWIADALAGLGNLAGLSGLSVVAASAPDEGLRARASSKLSEIALLRGCASGAELESLWNAGDARLAEPKRSRRYEREIWSWIARFQEFQLRGVDDARFVLERLDASAALLCAAALHDRDRYTRVHSAQCLERMGPRARGAVPELVLALRDPELASHAVAALGGIGEITSEPAMIGALAAGEAFDLRLSAARALGRFGARASAGAASALRALLAPSEPLELRQAAAESLVALGAGDEVAPFLLECLRSSTLEPRTTEEALARWLEAKAREGNVRAGEVLAAWNALASEPGAVVPAEEQRLAREQRRKLVQEALTDLLPARMAR